jgi:transposase
MIHEQKFATEPEELDRFLAHGSVDEMRIALEACVCWQFTFDYLNDQGYDVVLADPLRVRWIAASRKKTDRHDAKILADLLRTNILPKSYASPRDIREQRQITRHRASLTDLRTQLKNKVHAILLRHGINYEFSDVFGKAGMEYLASLDLSAVDRFELDQYLQLGRHFNSTIAATTEQVEDFVRFNPHARLLMTIPGVDYYGAVMIAAEIGDLRRFTSRQQVTSYAGLNPSIYQSGDTFRTGHISKQGNRYLRRILVQCANVAIYHDTTLARFYQRLKRRKNHGVAITATARKLLNYIYVMLHHNIPYHALQVHKEAS